MAQNNILRARWIRLLHRWHARRAARSTMATAFIYAPEPHTIGLVAKGRQLVAGHFLFSGLLVEGPEHSIWDIGRNNPGAADQIQGCGWLDDLAAVGDDRAREKAQTWVFEWIARYGDGKSDGWTPGVTGRRVIRWINHGPFLLRGQNKDQSHRFFQSLARQTLFLSHRWKAAPAGIRRFEALAGTIYASLSLEGMDHHAGHAVAALAVDCVSQIDDGGGIATRNPEELVEILALLNRTVQALSGTGHGVPAPIKQAIARIAPTVRALRHNDGGLARFHSGGSGIAGRADEALASSGVKTLPTKDLHMGFARLTGGRTSVIADAAPPPVGAASADAHASTLAFEMTSGRRPVIVSCGSGARFGDQWRRASRATPSHSTLMIEGVSSSHLPPLGKMGTSNEWLTEVPDVVRGNFVATRTGHKREMSHNGYQKSHGLTHARTLGLSVDGRTVTGEDLLTTLDDTDEATFQGTLAHFGPAGIPFAVRFHLHPDVEAALEAGDTAVSLRLKSGEVWAFQHCGTARVSLSASVYLQNGRLRPRSTQQVVLSGCAMAYATRVRWSLAKTQDTPDALRDLVQTDPMDAID